MTYYFQVLAKDLSGQNYCFYRLEIGSLGRKKEKGEGSETRLSVHEVRKELYHLLATNHEGNGRITYNNISEVIDFCASKEKGGKIVECKGWGDNVEWDLIGYQFFTYPQRSPNNWSDGQYWLSRLYSKTKPLKFPQLFQD